MHDFLYTKLSNYSAVSIVQARDLAEDGTFLCCMLVLIMSPMQALRKKQSGCGCVRGATTIYLESGAYL